MNIVIPIGKYQSYLSPPTTVLGSTLHDMPLITNTGVPLSLRESPRHQAIKGLVWVDKEEANEVEEKGVRALKRRKKSRRLLLLPLWMCPLRVHKVWSYQII